MGTTDVDKILLRFITFHLTLEIVQIPSTDLAYIVYSELLEVQNSFTNRFRSSLRLSGYRAIF